MYVSRKARIVLAGIPHHVTQRGNRKQQVFFCEEDRLFYLDLLKKYASISDVQVLSYCLMTNHVHHLLIPAEPHGLARLLKPLHMRYAQQINARYKWSGHLWQARFYSSPLDDEHFWAALRYIERNPVEAGMVQKPQDYRWSSAHLRARAKEDPYLRISQKWFDAISTIVHWSDWLEKPNDPVKVTSIRRNTQRDLPTGSDSFVKLLEDQFNRILTPRKVGRPPR
ncbi:MAG: transposase [Proteobacteria bacterium]|nr:MAG: transposase [Pseudomonadota bacterium]